MSFSRLVALILPLAAGFAIVAADVADARAGRGGSFGSRAGKTFAAPPPTNTAPKAAPIERSMAPKTAPASAQPGAAAAAQPSRFGGMRGLLMGGLFAAGLASIFGMGALASVFGFLLQFALIAGVVYLVMMLFRNRGQRPAFGSAVPQGPGRTTPGRTPQRDTLAQSGLARAAASSGGASEPTLTIGGDDFNSFERLLGEIQTAYGREDIDKLGAMTTPEMLSYFSEEISDNAKQGVRNEISDVKLLQGDLAEAWRESGSDYATVAVRYALIDATVERETGRVVSGDLNRPTEATELWTFRRDDRARADGWQLSAIQQA